MMNITNVGAYVQAHVHVFGFIETGALVAIFGLTPERSRREIKAQSDELVITYNRREKAWVGKPTSNRDQFSQAWKILTAVDSNPWPLTAVSTGGNADA